MSYLTHLFCVLQLIFHHIGEANQTQAEGRSGSVSSEVSRLEDTSLQKNRGEELLERKPHSVSLLSLIQ